MLAHRIEALRAGLKVRGTSLIRLEAERDLLKQQRAAAVERKLDAEAELELFKLVQLLLQKTSETARQQVYDKVNRGVTQALRTVFHDREYLFEARPATRAGNPTTEYWLALNGVWTQLEPPDYGRGGGAIDVIGTALRLMLLELYTDEKGHLEGGLWMDEVGKHVSADYALNFAYFLKEYSSRFNRQVIFITHSKELAEAGDKSFKVVLENDISKVTEIEGRVNH